MYWGDMYWEVLANRILTGRILTREILTSGLGTGEILTGRICTIAIPTSRVLPMGFLQACRACILCLVHVSKFRNIPPAYGTSNQSL